MDKQKKYIGIMIIVLVLGILLLPIASSLTLKYRMLFLVAMNILNVVVALILAKKQDISLCDLGFRMPKSGCMWLSGMLVGILPNILILLIAGNTGYADKTSLLDCIVKTLFFFFVVAPGEEIIFRGFLLETFLKNLTENEAIICTSLLFGLVHIRSGITVVFAFIISLLYCKIKLLSKNGSLYPVILGHAINDSLNSWIPYILF